MANINGETPDYFQHRMLEMVELELEREKRIFERNEKLLERLPTGYIESIKDKNGHVREFVTQIDSEKKKKRRFLAGEPEKRSEIRADFELRAAIRRSRKGLRKNIDLLAKVRNRFSVYDPMQFAHPTKDNRALLVPGQVIDLTDGKKNLSRNAFHDEDYRYITRRGEKVRSKSEMMIADILFEKGIDYLSDFGLQIGGQVFYPDFQVRRSDGRLVIWEHFGLVSNPDYVAKSYSKINLYGRAGFIAGQTLIITSESNSNPMTRDVILNVVEAFELV